MIIDLDHWCQGVVGSYHSSGAGSSSHCVLGRSPGLQGPIECVEFLRNFWQIVQLWDKQLHAMLPNELAQQ